MTIEGLALQHEIGAAVRHFWELRTRQRETQRSRGVRDQGARAAVTGGAQMDGFIGLLARVLEAAGFSLREEILTERVRVDLPGYFRPSKRWDLVVVRGSQFVAAVEVKSHIGPSFGNNFNNRTEEALGNAVDIWTAFRETAFQASPRPWLGYIMMLEDATASRQPVRVNEPYFKVRPEFHGTSYADRYAILLDRLVRERHYDAAALVLASEEGGLRGIFSEPDPSFTVAGLIRSLSAHVQAF